MRILVSHLGYGAGQGGAAVVAVPGGVAPVSVEAVRIAEDDDAADKTETRELTVGQVQTVPGWTVGPFVRCELPADLPAGRYVICAADRDGDATWSQEFAVEPDGVQRQTMSDVLA